MFKRKLIRNPKVVSTDRKSAHSVTASKPSGRQQQQSSFISNSQSSFHRESQNTLVKDSQTLFSDDEGSVMMNSQVEARLQRLKDGKRKRRTVDKNKLTSKPKRKNNTLESPISRLKKSGSVPTTPKNRSKKETIPNDSDSDKNGIDEVIDLISDDEEAEFQAMNKNNKSMLRTYKASVSKRLMQRNWTTLPTVIVNMVESILDLYIEESISKLDLHSQTQRIRFRTLVKDELTGPLMRKLRTIKLPSGIKERLLDQEELDSESHRLESNYAANLKQLELLEVEEQKEMVLLEKERGYLQNFKKNVRSHEKQINDGLKSLKELLGEESGILDGYAEFDNKAINLNLIDSEYKAMVDADDNDGGYDPSKDVDIMKSLENLNRHLNSISKNVESLNPVVDLLDRVNNLLQLLQ